MKTCKKYGSKLNLKFENNNVKVKRTFCMTNLIKLLVCIALLILSSTTVVSAKDFAWIDDFNVQAGVNLEDFKTRLAARFKVGAAEIEAVFRDIKNPADAYLIFRMGEMCSRPRRQIMEQYQSHKGQGWGVIAKNLGIKPGSPDFRSLKSNHDFSFDTEASKQKKKGKGKHKDKGNKGKKKK